MPEIPHNSISRDSDRSASLAPTFSLALVGMPARLAFAFAIIVLIWIAIASGLGT